MSTQRIVLAVVAAVTAVAAVRAASRGRGMPTRMVVAEAGAADRPVAIAAAPDGFLWVAMSAGPLNDGALAGLDPQLGFVRGWRLHGKPASVAAGRSARIYVDEHAAASALVSLYDTGGRHVRSLSFEGDVLALDTGPEGALYVLTSAASVSEARQVVRWGPDAETRTAWPTFFRAASLAVGPQGDVFVGYSTSGRGGIARHTSKGTLVGQWGAELVPAGMDFGPDGALYVAGKHRDGGSEVHVFSPAGRHVDAWAVRGAAADIAIPSTGAPVILIAERDGRPAGLVRHTAGGLRVRSSIELGGLSYGPHPPTATVTDQTAPGTPTRTTPRPTASDVPTATATVTYTPSTRTAAVTVTSVPGTRTATVTTAAAPATTTAAPATTTAAPATTTAAPATATAAPATTTPTVVPRTPHRPTSPSTRQAREYALHVPVALRNGHPPTQSHPRATPVEVVAGRLVEGAYPDDPYAILGVIVFRDELRLKVRFSGGCRQHSFRLVASGRFSESDPPAADALLAHDALGDVCAALVTDDLVFDMRGLGDAFKSTYPEAAGPLLLRMRNWPLEIRYIFEAK